MILGLYGVLGFHGKLSSNISRAAGSGTSSGECPRERSYMLI